MHSQPNRGSPSEHPTNVLVVLDNEEESSEEEQEITPWNDLCIIDRVGLNRAEMTEEQVETAFSQIALAFRSDQYTLKQRLLAQEQARNMAEYNIQLEMMRGRETLETLKALCVDSERSKVLQKLELCLDILEGTLERIFTTAEVLGAVHQEARVSRAVELMVSHVENLKRRQERERTELDESKRTNGKATSRNYSEHNDEGEIEDKDNKHSQQVHMGVSRRRVSIELITNCSQEKAKRERFLHKSLSLDNMMVRTSPPAAPPSLVSISESSEPSKSTVFITESDPCVMVKTDDVLDNRTPESPGDVQPEVTAAVQSPHQSVPAPADTPAPIHKSNKVVSKKNSRSSLDNMVRHRNRGKASLERKKNRENTKNTPVLQCTAKPCGPTCRERPLAPWLWHCRWVVLAVYLLVLCCVGLLIILFWLGP